MKRSHEVLLWMLGAGIGVSALSEEKTVEQLQQDHYASKEDCMQDWGSSEENCKDDTSSTHYSSSGGGGGSSSGGYRGPRYYWDRSAGHPVIVTDSGVHKPMPSAHPSGNAFSHSIGSSNAGSVTRGGFGHFGGRSGGG
jgi:hypothetical protein